jgi:hypothetical protein
MNTQSIIFEAKDGTKLEGDLIIPIEPKGIVILVSGSGDPVLLVGSRFLEVVHRDGIAVLSVQHLMRSGQAIEDQTIYQMADTNLLIGRLISCIDWAKSYPVTKNLPLGLLAANEGLAAAFEATSRRPQDIAAIVSLCGRMNIVNSLILSRVKAPTLLLVEENDSLGIIHNTNVLEALKSTKKKLRVVSGPITISDPSKLDEVASVTSGWLRCYFLIWMHSLNK